MKYSKIADFPTGGPLADFLTIKCFSGWVGWAGAGGERFFPGNSLGGERSPAGLLSGGERFFRERN